MHDPSLAENRGIPSEDCLEIDDIHLAFEEMFEGMDEVVELIGYDGVNVTIDAMEFKLQQLWRFPMSKEFHTYWYRNPKCLCPELDNQDRLGSGTRVINKTCPFHGDKK